MTATTTPAPGLRERKRLELRGRIRRTALDLMLERGYDAVTVEMICEAAEVSRRTFFNYFGSKELVVLGEGPAPLAEATRDAFVHGTRGEILQDAARLLFSHLAERPLDVDPQIWRDRALLLRSTPELASAMSDRMEAKGQVLRELAEQRLRLRLAENGEDPETDPAVHARLIQQTDVLVALWTGMGRCVFTMLVDHPTSDREQLTASLLSTLTLIQEAQL